MQTLCISSHGARMRVRAPADIVARLRAEVSGYTRVLEGGGPAHERFVVVPGVDDRFTLSRPGGDCEAEGDADDIVHAIVDRLHPLLSQNASAALFMHAAAFSWGAGVVLVPGRSHSGKSTLAAEAVRAGARYFSDEFAVVDDAGLVHPYPRPLSLREPHGVRRHVPATELGGTVATEPACPTLVVVTRHEAGGRWDPEVLQDSRAALPLIDNIVRARSDPQRTLRVASAIAAGATVLVGPRGEAAETVELIRERAARPTEALPA
jgi:hypothetical protein